MHDNDQAIALYEKLGFERVPFFTVKRKNPINEKFYAGPTTEEDLNPYAQIIVNEAQRHGIHVEVTDAEGGFFHLTYGGPSIHCREALSEFTTGVAVSICDDKAVTRRVVSHAGVQVPAQIEIGLDEPLDAADAFLKEHGSVVVKPARGEQGRGVAIDLSPPRKRFTVRSRARASSATRLFWRNSSRATTCVSSSSITGWWPPPCAVRRWWWATGFPRLRS